MVTHGALGLLLSSALSSPRAGGGSRDSVAGPSYAPAAAVAARVRPDTGVAEPACSRRCGGREVGPPPFGLAHCVAKQSIHRDRPRALAALLAIDLGRARRARPQRRSACELGLDVHSGATVWCLLDEAGETAGRGKVATTAPALTALVKRLSTEDELLVGQEVGTMSYFVHDTITAAGMSLLSFDARMLRMIASSRKKTDRRDAFWLER